MTPVRVQLRRTKGWRMPENTVSVARPGRWGNPFYIGGRHKVGRGAGAPGFAYLTAAGPEYADGSFIHIETAAQAVALYRRYMALYPMSPSRLEPLRGKNLACWCAPGAACHADVLLELANAPDLERGP